MKFLVGEFMHETNTFSSVPATLECFAEKGICYGEDIHERCAGTRTSLGAFIDVAERNSVELIHNRSPSARKGQEKNQ